MNPEKADSDWRANYWKREARESGFIEASNIDHKKPDKKTVIFLMELRGEL